MSGNDKRAICVLKPKKWISPRTTQRGCAATKIATDIITTKVAKSTKEEIEM
jgi:hypothetical protein